MFCKDKQYYVIFYHSSWMWWIFHRIFLVPLNTVMDMSNVMMAAFKHHAYTPYKIVEVKVKRKARFFFFFFFFVYEGLSYGIPCIFWAKCSRITGVVSWLVLIMSSTWLYIFTFFNLRTHYLPRGYDQGEPAVSYRWTGWVWENNQLEFETAGKLPIDVEEFHRIYPILITENQRMLTCNWLDWQTLGSQPVI